MSILNSIFARGGRHPYGLCASSALFIALVSACSGTDVTDFAGLDGSPSQEAASDTAEGNEADGLSLVANTDQQLAGTFTRGDRQLAFEINHDAAERVMAIYGANDGLLFRTTLLDNHEKVELGSELSLDGPAGSLLSAKGPAWDIITITGDASRLAELTKGPEFELVSELGAALAHRTGVNPALLDPAQFAGSPSEAGESFGTNRQALNLLSQTCIDCNLKCSEAYLNCALGQSGWAAWIYCAPPNVMCHASCVTSVACQ
jgi:hypothetical protein